MITFSATLTNGTIDFAGNIGSVSLYGKALYGQKLYSRGGAFVPSLSADISLVGQQYFVGNLAPTVTFGGKFGFDFVFVGNLAPTVTFSGGILLNEVLAGNLAPRVTFKGDLSLIVSFSSVLLEGGFYSRVDFAASGLISGPLWAESEPCPSSLWTPIAPCDPVEWQKSELCNG